MARLLDLLERQINLVERGLTPDIELLKEIAVFFRCFPDFCHHPKEDLIIAAIAARDAVVGRDLARLVEDHETGCAELQRFSRSMVDMLLDPAGKTATFLALGRKFLEDERRHMAFEDGPFFDIAEQTLTDEDWRMLMSRFAVLGMPDFEIESRIRFDRLDGELRRWRA